MKPSWLVRGIGFFCLSTALLGFAACAGRKPLERYAEAQSGKVKFKAAYVDAEFDFSAAVYEPTPQDLEQLRASWVEHGAAFPESKAFREIENDVNRSGQKIALVALFMTAYEAADLRDKNAGWAVSPVPAEIKELPDDDVVIRTLMPVTNPWARYFLLKYKYDAVGASLLVVSNRTSSLEFRN